MKWTNRGYEFDKQGVYLKGIKKIYIYGAGKLGMEFLHMFRTFDDFDCEIKFIDADRAKQKAGYLDLKVLSPEEFFQTSKEEHIVIVAASIQNTITIMEKMQAFGYEEDVDCFTVQRFLPIYSGYVRDKVYFPSISFLPTTRCNLNCEACLNFNPYNKNQTDIDLNILKADVDIFFQCVDYIGLFHISGGEPLLYPQLGHLIEYIDNNYRKKIYRLEITTNGTIILSDEICKILKKHNVNVILDDYTEALPQNKQRFEKVMNKMKAHCIEYFINKVDSWIDLCPLTTNHYDWNDQKLMDFYEACKNPFQELRDKKIYSCNYASYAMKAGLNVDSCNDYYDLTTFNLKKKKELIEFRLGYTEKGYVDFCKKCSGLSTTINKNIVVVAKQKS
ncbi:MAG: radical SAM protein [Anaeromicrobium sp.]|jgi:organic radical activating enzyme|uniref:radical SAM protein n=1 Tax=Anaeromicrobium sp. TaxID=1929132 RepID=UPI0025FEA4E2|nr:radical SAM protein [Anaeromicrobium sp.]MCT4592699.1 radical SAM protein [Anaeromicrobium sp.]